MTIKKKVAVIGGGAAGFFGAIACASANNDIEVSLFEKSSKLLSKVKVSGGGRCNLTHYCFNDKKLITFYPRGGKFLGKVFGQFSVQNTIEWFETRGVKTKAEEDGRMFPISDNSQSVIDCLVSEARVHGVKIYTQFGIGSIQSNINGFKLNLRGGETLYFDNVIIATGGSPNHNSYKWLEDLGHHIHPPVPSLFTFNVPNSSLNGLQGISHPTVKIKIAGSEFEQTGPLLITHWGFSGPAILKLSAWAARYLFEKNYEFSILINWIPELNEDQLRQDFFQYRSENPKKLVISNPNVSIPRRLWERMCSINEIDSDLVWGELPNRNINKMIEELIRGHFTIKGKTTFKEEFVTCGGIDLQEVNPITMESLKCTGAYFAGEILNIDGVTGGFNFQAAWSTGYVAGTSIAKYIK